MLSARSVQEIHSPRVFFFYWESCAVVQTNVFNYCFQHCNLSFCVRNSFILCCCFAGSWPGTVCESFNQKINNSSVPTYRNVIYAEENVKKSSRRRLSPVKHPLVLAALTESQYMVATPTIQPPSRLSNWSRCRFLGRPSRRRKRPKTSFWSESWVRVTWMSNTEPCR